MVLNLSGYTSGLASLSIHRGLILPLYTGDHFSRYKAGLASSVYGWDQTSLGIRQGSTLPVLNGGHLPLYSPGSWLSLYTGDQLLSVLGGDRFSLYKAGFTSPVKTGELGLPV